MIIAHASDLHGDWSLLSTIPEVPDLWVFTGDMMPNATRGHHSVEIPHQTHWYIKNSWKFLPFLGNAPVLLVPGNHDYADLAVMLHRDGVEAYEVKPHGVVVNGLRFSGFGNIPLIMGEWNRESTYQELHDLTKRSLDSDPDVLLTHAPPDGILNGDYKGIGAVTSALANRDHRVRLHLFGHSHEAGGKMEHHMGVTFVNSAQHLQLISL